MKEKHPTTTVAIEYPVYWIDEYGNPRVQANAESNPLTSGAEIITAARYRALLRQRERDEQAREATQAELAAAFEKQKAELLASSSLKLAALGFTPNEVKLLTGQL